MRRYHYQAIDQQGVTHQGTEDALNMHDLARLIWKNHRLSLIRGRPMRGRSFLNQIPFRQATLHDLSILCFHLFHLERAGVPILEGLMLLIPQSSSRLHDSLVDITTRVRQGIALSSAFACHPRLFNDFFVAVLKMGENTGKLSASLLLLQDYLSLTHEAHQQIKTVMRYPLIVGCITIGVMVGLLFFLVPQLEMLLLSTSGVLPWSTRLLLWLSHEVLSLLLVLIGGITITYISHKTLYVLSHQWASLSDRLYLKIPFVGPIVEKIMGAHFFQAMAIACKAGLTIETALQINAELLRNRWMRRMIERGVHSIEQGCSPATALKGTAIFPPLVVSMVSIAEKTGAVTEAFENLAHYYKRQLESHLHALIATLQPLLILFFGGLLLWVVLGLFTPLYDSSIHYGGLQ